MPFRKYPFEYINDILVQRDNNMITLHGISGRAGMVCREGYFRCGTGACINDTLVCDGVNHCRDTSDEDQRHAGCPGIVFSQYSSNDTLETIPYTESNATLACQDGRPKSIQGQHVL